MKNIFFIGCILTLYIQLLSGQSWQSTIVNFGSDGKLKYALDAQKNRIPDFSYAGYKRNEAAIPSVSVVETISPVAGDNTSNIQNAINYMGGLTPDANGIRGAVLLNPGMYRIKDSLLLNYDGVILRGSGNGDDSTTNTILFGTGDVPHQRTLVIAGGGSGTNKWSNQVSGTKTNITNDTLFVGDTVITVANAANLNVGDNIIIVSPSTNAWLAAVNYGGTHSTDPGADTTVDVPWTVSSDLDIVYNRYIKAKNGNNITIDIPIYYRLVKSLSQSYVYKYSRSGLLHNIGIENLRIDNDWNFPDTLDENHVWESIDMFQLEDSWVQNCTFVHFGHSGIRTGTASRITTQNCNAIDPISIITGERRYNYQLYTGSQQILIKNCFARNGRHHYVSNGTASVSGCVILNCTSSGQYVASEGHRRWSQALLFDNHTELDNINASSYLLGLYCRGYYGTSHGWAMVNGVAWNCNAYTGNIIIQQPPTGQNYAIGCKGGQVTGLQPYAPFNEAQGYIEGTNEYGLFPQSLFSEQLKERLTGIAEPTIQSSNVHFSNLTSSGATISCTAGNGTQRIIIFRAGSPVNSDPIDFLTYYGNQVYGAGSMVGAGNYVVYRDTGTAVTVTGLLPKAIYYFSIYELNSSSGSENYYISNPASGSFTTAGVTITAVAGTPTSPALWSLPNTWSSGKIPGATDDVLIPDGKGVLFDISAATKVASLTLGGLSQSTPTGFTVTKGTNFTITGDLTINGSIENQSLFTIQDTLNVSNIIINNNSVFTTSDSVTAILNITGNLTLTTATSIFKTIAPTHGINLEHLVTISGNLNNNLGGTMDLGEGTVNGAIGVWDFTFTGDNSTYSGPASPSVHNGEFNSITINKNAGSGITLLSDMWQLSISSTLNLPSLLVFKSGIFETGNFVFYYQNTTDSYITYTSNASSYVYGAFARPALSGGGSRKYPLGDIRYKLFTPTFGAAVSGNLVTCRIISGDANTGTSIFDPSIDRVSDLRYYRITYNKYTSTSDTLTVGKLSLSYDASDGISAGNTDLRIAYSTNSRSFWNTAAMTNPPITLTSGTIISDTLIGLNIASGTGELYTVLANKKGGGNNPLPVELVSFTSSVRGSEVDLKWETAAEINFSKFIIERSYGNNVWKKSGEINATSKSNLYQKYNFQERNVPSGDHYYRLKIVDDNGDFKYSETIKVSIEIPREFNFSQNYPNPFNPTTNLSYSLPVDCRVILKIYNLLGKEVENSVNENEKAGFHLASFTASGLPSGVYFCSIKAISVDGSKEYNNIKKMILTK